jgi:hypothetical protein
MTNYCVIHNGKETGIIIEADNMGKAWNIFYDMKILRNKKANLIEVT